MSIVIETKNTVFKGIIAIIGALFCLSVMTAGVKILAQDHHVIEIAFYRNLIAALPILGFIILKKRYSLFHVKRKKTLTARVLIGYIGMLLTFAAVDTLPLSDATVIFMASTIMVPVIAHFALGERTGWHRWAAIFIGFGGVFLAASPTGQVNTLGVLIALGAACGHATVQSFLRALRGENSITVTFYFLITGSLISAFFLPFLGNMPTMDELPLFIGIGIMGGLAQYLLALAFKNAPASVIAPFNYTGVLWAAGLDILIWNYVPTWPVFVGGAIIIASKLYIVHREQTRKKLTDS